MRNTSRAVWPLLTAVAVGGCGDASLAEPRGLGVEAANYLAYALNVMEFNSIRRYEIDWESFRAEAIEDAGEARSREEIHPVIEAALVRLGDNHSFFERPPEATGVAPRGAGSQADGPQRADPSSELIEAGTGYVDVPAFSQVGAPANELAGLYHELIEAVDTLGVCRWVVDLRGNTGGNMWPMVAGLGPILGEGTLGYFVDPDSVVNEWYYEAGNAGIDDVPFSAALSPYLPTGAAPPIAVLTNSLTASAGEAVTVAFRGRPETRSFGEATFGVPTANAGFRLSDGAVIYLTVAWTADRDGTVYSEPLAPDEAVAGSKTGDRTSDAALDAALDWLGGFPCS